MPLADRQAHIFPDLAKKALISIGQLFKNGFTATFNTTSFPLSDGFTTICGNRDPKNGLYCLDMVDPPTLIPLTLPTLQSFTAYEMKTNSDLVQYLHCCAFSPIVTTCTKAIDAGNFSTWPGLTSELVCKHLPNPMATSKGNLQ